MRRFTRLITSTSVLTIALGALVNSAGAQPVTVPYFQDFESFATCSTACGAACVLPAASGWMNATTEAPAIDWAVDIGGTPSSPTGPGVDHTLGNATGRYLYLESSGCQNRVAELLSPVITLPPGTSVMSLWYHMFGATQGTLHIDVIDDPNGAAVRTNNVVPPRTDNVDLWQQFSCIPLSSAAGSVQVVIRGTVGTSFTSDMAIDDFAVNPSPPGGDAAVTAISVPGGCAGPAPVTVTVLNLGGVDLIGTPLTLTIDGVTFATETLNQSVATCGQTNYTFNAVPVLMGGPATIAVTAALPGDGNAANNTVSRVVNALPVVAAFPYAENFDTPAGGNWATGGANNSWALGTPAKAVMNSAFSAPNVWTSGGLAGSYSLSEYSWVEGPCFNISAMTNPRVEANVWWDSEFSWDGGQLQYSVDGVTWNVVGAVGSAPNWYNDTTVVGLAPSGNQHGWSGRGTTGSNGWLPVGHDLGLLGSGAQNVRIRFAFGSDTSVIGEGFAVDNVRLFDNPPRVEVADFSQPSVGAVVPGTNFNFVQALELTAFLGPVNVNTLTVTKLGTLADGEISGVRVWLDDGDGLPDVNNDTMVGGVGTFAGGVSNIPLMNVTVTPGSAQALFVTYDIASSAAGGGTFGSSFPDAAAITANRLVVLSGGAGLSSPIRQVFDGTSALPYVDDFEAALASRTTQVDAGNYPTATSTGAIVGTTVTAGGGGAYLLSSVDLGGGNTIVPNSGSGMAVLVTPSGGTAAALDLHLDMSGFDVVDDDIFLTFSWNNAGQQEDPEDKVFLSVDGGTTWLASIYDFDFSTPVPPGWRLGSGDISGALRAAGQAFTNNMVVRIQVGSFGKAGLTALAVDDIAVSIPPAIRVERIPGVRVVSGSTDNVGNVPGASQRSLTYTVRNVGLLDLTVNPASVVVNNLTNVVVLGTVTSSASIAPGSRGTVRINYAAPVGGPFSMQLNMQTNDPRLAGGIYTAVISGMSIVDPDIAVRAGRNDVANGGTDDIGLVRAGRDALLDFTIANVGDGTLNLTSPTLVQIENQTNVTATLASTPPAVITPFGQGTFNVRYSATGLGAFSFDVVIPNNDPDDGTYRITVIGRAIAPDIALRRGVTPIASGSTEMFGMLERGVAARFSYTIDNNGDAPLMLTATPPIAISGVTGGDVQVTSQPAATVTQGSIGTFTISVTPSSNGPVAFTATILSDDPDQPTYTFSGAATGFTPAPELEVTREGMNIANEAMEDAGTSVPRMTQSWTYTIQNSGTAPLTIQSVQTRMPTNVQVSILNAPSGALAAGATASFTVDFSPRADGAFSFGILIENDDADEAAFTIQVSGQGLTTAPEIEVEQPIGSVRASGTSIALGIVDVGQSISVPFVIRNLGNVPLIITKAELLNASNVTATLTQPSASIEAGESANFAVSLVPTGARDFAVTLSIENNDGNEGVFTVRLTGSGKVTLVDSGGCSCSATEQARAPSSAWAALAVGLLFLVRRRRR